MSDNTETSTEMSAVEAEVVEKYKTVGRAVKQGDAKAAKILADYLKKTGNPITEDEVLRLGLMWFNSGKKEDRDMVDFLSENKFDFTVYVTVTKEERTGEPLPFRLIGDDEREAILVDLIKKDKVPVDLLDSLCGGMLVHALMLGRFDFADQLVKLGADVNQANLSGEAALHLCAAKLNFKGCKWLLDNGADPCLESLNQSRAAELVPEGIHDEFDGDVLYNNLIEAIDCKEAGTEFTYSEDFLKFVAMEEQMYAEQAEKSKAKKKPGSP